MLYNKPDSILLIAIINGKQIDLEDQNRISGNIPLLLRAVSQRRGQIQRNAATRRDKGNAFLPTHDQLIEPKPNILPTVKAGSIRQLPFIVNANAGTDGWFDSAPRRLNGVIKPPLIGRGLNLVRLNKLVEPGDFLVRGLGGNGGRLAGSLGLTTVQPEAGQPDDTSVY